MKYRGLTKNQIRVHKALEGGPTFSELMHKLNGKPSRRQVRTILSQLENMGWAKDALRGKRGRIPHRWFPEDGTYVGSRILRRPIRAAENHDELTEPIYQCAKEAVMAIRSSSRCRERSRTREICSQYIKPTHRLITKYNEIEHRGPVQIVPSIRLPTIAEFLIEPMYDGSGKLIRIKRSKGARTRSGTIGVRHPKSTSRQDLFYPTIEEWDQYMNHILWLLREEHLYHAVQEHRREHRV